MKGDLEEGSTRRHGPGPPSCPPATRRPGSSISPPDRQGVVLTAVANRAPQTCETVLLCHIGQPHKWSSGLPEAQPRLMPDQQDFGLFGDNYREPGFRLLPHKGISAMCGCAYPGRGFPLQCLFLPGFQWEHKKSLEMNAQHQKALCTARPPDL